MRLFWRKKKRYSDETIRLIVRTICDLPEAEFEEALAMIYCGFDLDSIVDTLILMGIGLAMRPRSNGRYSKSLRDAT
jgi:hypothetical protein